MTVKHKFNTISITYTTRVMLVGGYTLFVKVFCLFRKIFTVNPYEKKDTPDWQMFLAVAKKQSQDKKSEPAKKLPSEIVGREFEKLLKKTGLNKRDEQIQYAHHITETINSHFFQYCNFYFLYSISGYYV